VIDKIIEGKLEKFFTDQCLLEQPFIKDASGKTKIRELVDTVNAKTASGSSSSASPDSRSGEGG
jgi:elongation factor Ts